MPSREHFGAIYVRGQEQPLLCISRVTELQLVGLCVQSAAPLGVKKSSKAIVAVSCSPLSYAVLQLITCFIFGPTASAVLYLEVHP
jgi:hypothetical protein